MAKISVIIPCRKIEEAKQCIKHCHYLPEEKEVIVVPDSVCPGLPAEKRNWAMDFATGDIFAFIDADAYPSPIWLKTALYWLQTFDAVCGPGVLPPDAPKSEQVADQVHRWVFCPYRVRQERPRIVPWHPTFNLLVKRSVASKFPLYLTGEDDKFGLNIKDGIFYHPDILVYHHRREAFRPLWRQFGTYGKHKGHFFALSLIAWLTTLFTYATNFVYGMFKRRI